MHIHTYIYIYIYREREREREREKKYDCYIYTRVLMCLLKDSCVIYVF
jgi:hypothetical protein